MNFGSIYIATNSITGEQYVGQTRQKFATRVYAHKISALKPKFKINYAIAKYGFENFKFEQVFIAFDRDSLNYAEKIVIADLNPAYNMTKGGAGMPGPVSDALKAKRSEQAKIRWANPDWKSKTVKSIRAACKTEEFVNKAKERLQNKNLAAIRWKDHVKKVKEIKDVSKSIRDTWKNPDIRAKRIAGLRRALSTPEVKAKFSAANRGRKMSKEAIDKTAKAKHKHLYCEELQCTFLSQKHAAKYFNLGNTAITEALKRKGKVRKMYTLIRVS